MGGKSVNKSSSANNITVYYSRGIPGWVEEILYQKKYGGLQEFEFILITIIINPVSHDLLENVFLHVLGWDIYIYVYIYIYIYDIYIYIYIYIYI